MKAPTKFVEVNGVRVTSCSLCGCACGFAVVKETAGERFDREVKARLVPCKCEPWRPILGAKHCVQCHAPDTHCECGCKERSMVVKIERNGRTEIFQLECFDPGTSHTVATIT